MHAGHRSLVLSHFLHIESPRPVFAPESSLHGYTLCLPDNIAAYLPV